MGECDELIIGLNHANSSWLILGADGITSWQLRVRKERWLLNCASDHFFQTLYLRLSNRISVYKLIGIILAAVPVVLFLKAIMGQSRKRSQAVSDFKKHMDYVFWVIMLLVGCGVIYSLGKLLYEFAR